MADSISRLARRLDSIEKQIRAVATQPQLAHSSVEDGSIDVNRDDETVMVIGQQYDGTHTSAVVAGPVPPTPESPLLAPGLGGLRIYWDGTFANALVAPMDFARVTIHAQPLDEFVDFDPLDQRYIVGTFETATGGELIAALPYEEHIVHLVTWSQAGRPSPASLPAVGLPNRVSAADLAQEVVDAIEAGGGPTSDGDKPTTSPTPEVISGYGAFYLRWVAPSNPDPLEYEVHLSDVAGFTPSAATLYGTTSATSMTVKRLPDGAEPEDKSFQYAVPYHFAVVAKDADGPGPKSAEGSAELAYIQGTAIAAQTITGDRIVTNSLYGDLFSSQIATSSTFTTGAYDETTGQISGARSEMGPAGIDTVDTTGRTIFHMPTDAADQAYVRANLEAETLRILGGLSMEGINNELAQGSRLTLSEGVTAPTLPLTVSASYPLTYLNTTTAYRTHAVVNGDLGVSRLNPANITSFCWMDGWDGWLVSEQKSKGVRLWHFDVNGQPMRFAGYDDNQAWIDDWEGYSKPSVTQDSAGTATLLFWEPTGQFYIWGHTPGGTSVINKIPTSWIAATATPTLSFDFAANQYILAYNGSEAIQIRRFTLQTPELSNAVSQSTMALGNGTRRTTRLIGFETGAGITNNGTLNRYAFASENFFTVSVTGASAGSGRISNEEFLLSTTSLGFTRARERNTFFSIAANGQITEYSNWTWLGGADDHWYVGYTWYDDDAAGGTHETPLGGVASVAAKKRSWLRARLPAGPSTVGPDTPNKRRLYYARGASKPANSGFGLLATVAASSAVTFEVSSEPGAGVAPPAANNFPGATPAILDSAGTKSNGDSTWELTGSGAGNVGPWAWDDDGKMVAHPGAAGVRTCPVAALNTNYSVSVTFPRPFSSPPAVTLTPLVTQPHTVFVSVSSVTTTGFDIVYRRSSYTDFDCNWIAQPMG